MTRCLFVLTVFTLLTLSSLSQPAEVTLVDPDPETYIAQLDDILAEEGTVYFDIDDLSHSAEALVMTDEINWRYIKQNRLNYRQLDTIFHAFIMEEFTPHNLYYYPDDRWIGKIIERWLSENPTSFYLLRKLQFGEYTIEVTQPDGYYPVYILRVVDGPPYVLKSYVAISTGQDTYTIPNLPAPIYGEPMEIGDFNGDRNIDFAYIHSTHNGNSYNAGQLLIVSLVEDHFETIATLDYSEGATHAIPPESFSWQFVNLDSEPDQEIVQNERLYDNWGCTFVKVGIFDWQEDGKLKEESTTDVFPPSFNCLQRRGEQAMWAHRYADAIEFYEQSLQVVHEGRLPYLQMRLGLAYLLSEQPEKAREVFQNLDAGDDIRIQTIRQAYAADSRVLPLCQAIYNAYAANPDYENAPGNLDTYDGGFYGPFMGYGFDLENASCDLPSILNAQLQQTTFTTASSPLEQLEALGLKISSFVSEDLDSNGSLEWLIWIDSIRITPIFFFPDGDSYQISRPRSGLFSSVDLRSIDEYNNYFVVDLPEGKALVNVDMGVDPLVPDRIGGGGIAYCDDRDPLLPANPGELTLWRVENGELVNFIYTPMCKQADVEELFSADRRELHAFAYFEPSPENFQVAPASYYWDADLKTYLAPPQPTPTPTLIPSPTPVETPVYSYGVSGSRLYDLHQLFDSENYDLMIDVTADVSLSENPLAPAFRYYRALAFEALNRPDEALAEYVAIYDDAPDSTWGKLAALHFAPSNTNR